MSREAPMETFNGIKVRSIADMIDVDPLIWGAVSSDPDRLRKILNAKTTMWRLSGPRYIEMAMRYSKKFREYGLLKTAPVANLRTMHEAGVHLDYCLMDLLSRAARNGDKERLAFAAEILPPFTDKSFWLYAATSIEVPRRPYELMWAVAGCHPDCAQILADLLPRLLKDADLDVLAFIATSGRQRENIKFTSALLVAGADFFAMPIEAFEHSGNPPELTAHYAVLRHESSSNHEKLETMLEEPDLAAVIARPLTGTFFGSQAGDTPINHDPEPAPSAESMFIESKPIFGGIFGDKLGFLALFGLIAFLAMYHLQPF
jgi:hypothetical protein